jgi:hypothetical protein
MIQNLFAAQVCLFGQSCRRPNASFWAVRRERMTDLQGLGRVRSRPPPSRFWKGEMKIIWCAGGFTARISEASSWLGNRDMSCIPPLSSRQTETNFRIETEQLKTQSECAQREKRGFMTDLKFVSWKEIFLKTMDETDPEKLSRLVPEAELAIFKRQQGLYNCPQHSEELSTMCVASEALRVVKHRIAKPLVLASSKGNGARFANFVRRSGTA